MLPLATPGARQDAVVEHLGDSTVALFTKPRDPECPQRSLVTKIPLRQFFERQIYRTHTDVSYRIVSNIKNRPEAVNHLAGFDAAKMFDYQALVNSANLWVSYRGLFGRSHLDEFENFKRAA